MVSLFAHRRFEHNQVTIKRNSFPRQPHYNFICNLKKNRGPNIAAQGRTTACRSDRNDPSLVQLSLKITTPHLLPRLPGVRSRWGLDLRVVTSRIVAHGLVLKEQVPFKTLYQ